MTTLPTITSVNFPEDQYIHQPYDKHQIYMHHTAGSSNPYSGAIEWWESNADRVGTPFVIARGSGRTGNGISWEDGEIIQLFGSGFAAWHLGLKQSHLAKGQPGAQTSTWLNLNTIGIEMCNWGQLIEKNGKFLTYEGSAIPETQVITYPTPYRGYTHYHKYSDAQLESARQLLLYLCEKWQIDPKFKGMAMFDINPRALRGENGIWTHTSVRPDKFDCHPQRELIQMLGSL